MKILLPLDDSEPSKTTLDWVIKTFKAQQPKLYVLTVVEETTPEIPTMSYQVEDALKLLEQTTATLTQAGLPPEKAEYVVGDPVQSICQYAEEAGVDQIIIGSHGRTGWIKLLLGSVSSGVFECAKVPVFVFKNVKTKQTVTA
ncbi:MAG: universal stress protein [Cyanobacteria bacterium HKST-UBA06]|nr:universal stress protein [Cyanobacteria bacterium HKST-UBA05]MCA9798576.1 universal stress protein [Cyanobacteria bacterium HKST-UBA04]MCA9807174.1 universal stress protein [Cyanobacteria bacterium HKST-UBA06]MCA9841571.1 universal stress protein [Cyanobacteria bacterium HKST-UBA03]